MIHRGNPQRKIPLLWQARFHPVLGAADGTKPGGLGKDAVPQKHLPTSP